MKESELYLMASLVAFCAFIACAYYCSKNQTLNYQNTVILVLGLLSLAKSVEYYEKYTFKLTTKH